MFKKLFKIREALPKPSVLPKLEFFRTGTPHTHVDRQGFLIDCYHSTKNVLLSMSFWLGVTFSFPLEHFLWEKVWPFSAIHTWMGL